jgi:hypothetical protein
MGERWLYDLAMGELIRRTGDGDEVLLEWSRSDPASVSKAKEAYRHWLAQDYEAVQSDGTFFQPLVGDEFPVDARQVVLSTGMGGG